MVFVFFFVNQTCTEVQNYNKILMENFLRVDLKQQVTTVKKKNIKQKKKFKNCQLNKQLAFRTVNLFNPYL